MVEAVETMLGRSGAAMLIGVLVVEVFKGRVAKPGGEKR